MQIGNLDVFLESITIALACNELLRKRFPQPDTIGLIPTVGYTCNKNYSKRAMMWLMYMQETDGIKIMHGREYKEPELPQFAVDGYCPETRTIYEFLDVIFTVTHVNRSVTSSPLVAIH